MMLLRIVAPLLAFLVVGLASLPLSVVMAAVPVETSGLAASDVSGTVWRGNLAGVTWRGQRAGDFRIGMQPQSIASGRPAIRFQSVETGVTGQVRQGADGVALDAISGRLPLLMFQPSAPPEAHAILNDVSLTTGLAGCLAASGSVQIDGLSGVGTGPLSGSIACENGNLALNLSGADGGPGFVLRLDLNEAPGLQAPAATTATPDPRPPAAAQEP